MSRMHRSPVAFAAPALALLLALTGCQSSTDPATADGALTFTDPWVKAADSGMTAAFGTVVNSSDEDVVLVAARSEVSLMELHEMATDASGGMVMRAKEGGFVVPAQGSLELAPGGEHLMFMDLTSPLAPGDDVEVTVVADDDRSWTFTAPVRTFTGANEEYVGETDGTTDETGGTHGSESPMPTSAP
ncbi:copper chaperone PCu(A)C [Actinotalea sp.]|uniref:copper chaperone PCu(A)C n=1 Tax=Actinotalea sp. TaxID=1872145 RepID=UPI003569B110